MYDPDAETLPGVEVYNDIEWYSLREQGVGELRIRARCVYNSSYETICVTDRNPEQIPILEIVVDSNTAVCTTTRGGIIRTMGSAAVKESLMGPAGVVPIWRLHATMCDDGNLQAIYLDCGDMAT